MAENTDGEIHWSFWGIGIFPLIWNAMGSLNFYMQMNPEMLASMPETHRMIAETRPVWATAGFALSVGAGVLGSLLLLLKKSAAVSVFIASLIGTVVTMFQALFLAGVTSIFGPFEMVMAVFTPLILGGFLVWYSRLSKARGWIS